MKDLESRIGTNKEMKMIFNVLVTETTEKLIDKKSYSML